MAGPSRSDVLLAAAVLVVGATEALLVDDVPARAVAVGAAVVGGAALAWRRAAPLLTAVVVAAGPLAGAALLGTSLDALVAPTVVVLLAAYSVGAAARRPTARAGLAVLLGPGAAGAVLAETGPEPADLAFAAVVVGGAWLAGSGHRARAAYAAVQEDRAAALERERDARAAEAIAAERLRIARELHDGVTHALSVMTLQAGGVRRRLPATADREQEALRAVERTGRQALAEMARMLGVLRAGSENPDLKPQPGLADLPELAARVSASGVETRVRVDGEPYALPPSLDLSAYRIAQEALTNVLKHSGAGRAEVLLGYEPGRLRLEVHDDGNGGGCLGPDGRGGERPPAGGHGMVGMRERVAVFGGTLEAGTVPGGGYRVSARLPVPREVR